MQRIAALLLLLIAGIGINGTATATAAKKLTFDEFWRVSGPLNWTPCSTAPPTCLTLCTFRQRPEI